MSQPADGATTHNPGGQVKWPLQDDVEGDGEFSGCCRYRYWLSRIWGLSGQRQPPFGSLKVLETRLKGKRVIVWIAMNPSTADATKFDDPTVRREIGFSRKWGYDALVKLNMCDWRATKPKDLPKAINQARSARNLPTILSVCGLADKVVLACGNLPKPLRPVFDETVSALKTAGITIYYFKKTQSGFPAHPLFLPSSSTLAQWP